jgi:hypothetical protein
MTINNGDPDLLPIILIGIYVYLVAVAPIIVVALPLLGFLLFLLVLLR